LFAKRLSAVLGYQYADEALINKIDEAPEVRNVLAAHMEDESAPGFLARVASWQITGTFLRLPLKRAYTILP